MLDRSPESDKKAIMASNRAPPSEKKSWRSGPGRKLLNQLDHNMNEPPTEKTRGEVADSGVAETSDSGQESAVVLNTPRRSTRISVKIENNKQPHTEKPRAADKDGTCNKLPTLPTSPPKPLPNLETTVGAKLQKCKEMLKLASGEITFGGEHSVVKIQAAREKKPLMAAYKSRLLDNLYPSDKDRDPTPQQAPIEKNGFTLNQKANGNVDPQDDKRNHYDAVQKRKKKSMMQENQRKREEAARQEELAGNPICLDYDDDDEVKEGPPNMDNVRVPRKRVRPSKEDEMVEYGDSQTHFDDAHSRPSVGKRQSFLQSPPASNNVHTQPDSSGEKSKRLHIQDDDDNESYTRLRSSQTSEHPSELCHRGQHLDHVEVLSSLDNLESPPFDTAKLKTALNSIEKEEPGSWNLNDELERSETTKPCVGIQKVNGNEKKNGTCGAEQKETC
jgi:hypothetical protein